MNKLSTLFAAALLVVSTQVSAKISLDKAAPDFSATTASGKTVKLSDFKGKKVILEWTNADCPFVKKHYNSDNMQSLQKKYTEQGVVWLSVISSAKGKQGHVTAAEAKQLTDSRSATPSEVLLDDTGSIGKMYSAKTTPHMYIIDEKGMLRYMGAIDSVRSANPADIAKSVNYVDKAMTELASGKQVSEPITQAYGCSVKY